MRLRRLRDDRGTALVMITLLFTALLALVALAFDFGSWYRAQRNLQAAADAAALAGAQDLPNTATAASSASSYANANATGLNSWSPSFPDTNTIDISLSKDVSASFAKLVGINSKTVHAHARAQIGSPGSMKNVVPVGIKSSAACATGSTGCFFTPKTLTFDDSTTASFGSSTWGLLDLSGGSASSSGCSGNVGEGTEAGWVTSGYPGILTVNNYYGATTGQRTSIRNSLNAVVGKLLLIPVFDNANLSWCGNKGGFHVIGWAAFVIDQAIPNSDWNPHLKILHGHFETYIPTDVVSTPGVPGFGVKTVALIQ